MTLREKILEMQKQYNVTLCVNFAVKAWENGSKEPAETVALLGSTLQELGLDSSEVLSKYVDLTVEVGEKGGQYVVKEKKRTLL